MGNRTLLVLIPLVAAGLTNCSEMGGCTLSVEPGIVVEIRDAADGTPIAATASGTVSAGTYQDSLQLYDLHLSRAGAFERPGIFTVQVAHPGYVGWERTGVRVRDSGCHVDTVTLQADLQRAP
jgi:hypothetical protein